MEIRELQCFLVLSEELHFGRVAARLYVSQARVSQLLKALESRIGGVLVERTSRRVRLTPLGERFLAELRPAYSALASAVDRAQAATRGVSDVLRVGFVGTPNEAVMGTVRTFEHRHSDCEVRIAEMTLADPIGPLLRDEVDAVFICQPIDEPGLTAGPVVLTERRALAVPVGHPFAARSEVSAEDLAACEVIDIADPAPSAWRDFLAPRVTPGGRPIPRGPVATTLQEVLSLVSAGRGVMPFPALIEDYHGRPDVVFVPITGLPDSVLALVWPTNRANARIFALAASVTIVP